MKRIVIAIFCIFILTANAGAQWIEQTSGVNSLLFSVSAVDDNVVWACGVNGVVIRTVNSGVNWTVTTSPNPLIDFHCIQGIDANTALVGGSGSDAYAYKTIDGGATWVQTFFQTGGFVNNIKQFNGFPGIYGLQGDPVGGRWTQFVSVDYGSTWDSTGFYKPAAVGEAGWNNSFFAATPSFFSWYGTNNSKLIQAFANGTSIDRPTPGLPESYAVWGNDNNRIMTGGSLKLLYSVDQGASWTDVGALGSGDIAGIVGGRNSSIWYYVRGSEVYGTINNGTVWTLSYVAPGGIYYHISLSPRGGFMWAVRDNGGISRYTFDIPLPVELSSFTSAVNGNNVTLSWSTLAETNNSAFEIERAVSNGWVNNVWTKIGFVNGNGTSSTPNNYVFTDHGLNSGKYNYRIKQIDYNGNFSYYNLQNDVVIGVPESFSLSQNYPNPFNPSTRINYNIPFGGQVSLKVFDISGREVGTLVTGFKTAGTYTANFNASGLSSGVYIYRLTANFSGQTHSAEKRMLLMK